MLRWKIIDDWTKQKLSLAPLISVNISLFFHFGISFLTFFLLSFFLTARTHRSPKGGFFFSFLWSFFWRFTSSRNKISLSIPSYFILFTFAVLFSHRSLYTRLNCLTTTMNCVGKMLHAFSRAPKRKWFMPIGRSDCNWLDGNEFLLTASLENRSACNVDVSSTNCDVFTVCCETFSGTGSLSYGNFQRRCDSHESILKSPTSFPLERYENWFWDFACPKRLDREDVSMSLLFHQPWIESRAQHAAKAMGEREKGKTLSSSLKTMQ